jgi:glycosidase
LKRLLRLALLEGSSRPAVAGALREFHVSRDCRRRYQFNQALFSLSGNVVLADYQAVRVFAQKLNEGRGAAAGPVRAGALNAMGLIDEVLHHVAALYAAQVRPAAFRELLAELEKKAGAGELRRALLRFSRDFPSLDVQQGRISPEEHLLGTVQGVPNREVLLEEMLLLWLANANPAFAPFRELFADEGLARDTCYPQLPGLAREFFAALPPFGPDGQNLIDMLRSPALAHPDSLAGQLRYIREKWGLLLGRFLERLLIGGDLIREDEKTFPPGAGPAPVFDPVLAERQAREEGGEEAAERFSPDREWMPRLVLMAKTVYVWLDQLSRAYGRPIATLDAIPDEELDRLAGWGFTGLWLIGVWERSPASRRIKQACGNPEAMASAYSLYRYEIAADLGGEAALENLRARAWARGLRLASDMVPNHMGIDSPWVIEHPEWFISLDQSPFPSYRFTGEDLSGDPRVGIYLEDHYYDRSDAAVVFKWVDRRSGRERYIYHGNDGTRMPWNDTAQLNYLRPDVREAVMQAIMGVARLFPVIRFDAAMTLARSHYQRLWYPPPGAGGDIPSRAGMGMTPEQFRHLMPWEFWREVVDRMAREAPDTLLLAEAFWLMESYFVRTLGMHRVYNSAFMNFLKMEENAKFRQSLKNALEFNPEILRRFVNFMNNPDEDTAWAQFGGGDKYFGACTLLAALPGLPMFGHGQVEGFREKYGMEYRRAYLDERPDGEFIRGHERRIFPLLRRRALFAGVEEFRLYDFFAADGRVDENVIAFSNFDGEQRGLVVFNNRFAATAGWIRLSAAFAAEDPFGGPRVLRQEGLGKGLGLSGDGGRYVVFRDLASGLSYLRASAEVCEKGLYLELGAYQAHAFLDIEERSDGADGRLAKLAAFLQGRGVPSLEDVEQELALRPLHEALAGLCRPELARRLLAVLGPGAGSVEENSFWLEVEEWAGRIGNAAAAALAPRAQAEPRAIAEGIVAGLLESRGAGALAAARDGEAGETGRPVADARQEEERAGRLLLAAGLGSLAAGPDERWEQLRLGAAVELALRGWGLAGSAAAAEAALIRFFCAHAGRIAAFAGAAFRAGEEAAKGLAKLTLAMLEEPQLAEILKVNSFQGETFFNREAFSDFTGRLRAALEWEFRRARSREKAVTDEDARTAMELLDFIPSLARQAKYKVNDLKKLLLEFSETK